MNNNRVNNKNRKKKKEGEETKNLFSPFTLLYIQNKLPQPPLKLYFKTFNNFDIPTQGNGFLPL